MTPPQFLYLAAYVGRTYRVGLSYCERPALGRIKPYNGRRPCKLVGVWRIPAGCGQSIIGPVIRQYQGKAPKGFLSAPLSRILPKLALYIHARRSRAIQDVIEDEGRTMPPMLSQAATLAFIDRLDDFMEIGLRVAEQGIHPTGVISDPELIDPLVFRETDRLMQMGSAIVPSVFSDRVVDDRNLISITEH